MDKKNEEKEQFKKRFEKHKFTRYFGFSKYLEKSDKKTST